ncbi:hypothetical protein [Mariniplasma anaerobium]|uniref:Uncharacterized protein n=1 Tax=Mariniplasma anaerobium TaxID=2735436 RepID=A0A7U9TH88_9MOLU|nr:hypothetical protein [Mariniplasma anaerobium]BCR35776.1 hypothetical protein MPAN_006690 [Mariniplasma anaerobium]
MTDLMQFIFITLAIIVFSSFLLTGLRMAVHRYFDFQIDKKLFYEYLVFHLISLLSAGGAFLFIPFGQTGVVNYAVLSFWIIFVTTILILEYFIFYRRHFNYESGNKYFVFLIVSYFANTLILVVVLNVLIIVGGVLGVI